jgi:hypothetical protein
MPSTRRAQRPPALIEWSFANIADRETWERYHPLALDFVKGRPSGGRYRTARKPDSGSARDAMQKIG